MMCAMLRLSSKLEYVIKGKEMKSKLQHAAVQEEFLLAQLQTTRKAA